MASLLQKLFLPLDAIAFNIIWGRYYQIDLCKLILLFLLIWTVNRRLDEWVKLDQLDLDSVEAVVDEKVEDKVMLYCSFNPFPNPLLEYFQHQSLCPLRFPKCSLIFGFHKTFLLL